MRDFGKCLVSLLDISVYQGQMFLHQRGGLCGISMESNTAPQNTVGDSNSMIWTAVSGGGGYIQGPRRVEAYFRGFFCTWHRLRATPASKAHGSGYIVRWAVTIEEWIAA